MGLAIDPDASECRKVLEAAQKRQAEARAFSAILPPAVARLARQARPIIAPKAKPAVPQKAWLVAAPKAGTDAPQNAEATGPSQAKVTVMLGLDRDVWAKLANKGTAWKAWVNEALRTALEAGD
jgi:uncharacterized protein (DUF4415 family)